MAELQPGAAGAETGSEASFADALLRLASAPDEAVPPGVSDPAADAATGSEAADETAGAAVVLPALIHFMLPVAAHVPAAQTQELQDTSAPAATAVEGPAATKGTEGVDIIAAGSRMDGLALPAAGLLLRQEEPAARTGFADIPSLIPGSPEEQDIGTVRMPAVTRQVASSMPAQAMESTIPVTAREQGASAAAVADPAVAVATAGMPVETAAEGASLKLPNTPPQQWRQPLADALGERIRTHVGARSESAVIRLDPPMMGQIEIRIHHEAGALQVQLNASHGEVARQLNEIRDHLRQDLVQRQFTDVSVLVSGNSPDGRQRQRQQEAEYDEPGRALSESGREAATFALLSDKD